MFPRARNWQDRDQNQEQDQDQDQDQEQEQNQDRRQYMIFVSFLNWFSQSVLEFAARFCWPVWGCFPATIPPGYNFCGGMTLDVALFGRARAAVP